MDTRALLEFRTYRHVFFPPQRIKFHGNLMPEVEKWRINKPLSRHKIPPGIQKSLLVVGVIHGFNLAWAR